MRKIHKATSLILIFMMFSVIFFTMFQNENHLRVNTSEFKLTIKTLPLEINGNNELNATKSSGNGTEGNPYIIENYIIDTIGKRKDGILIKNTDAYFIIRNCTFTNADYGYSGIKLENVKNGTLTNNTVRYNEYYGYGIYLNYSDYNNLYNNTLNDNHYGIYLNYSNYNKLQNNTINDNYFGIFLSYSSYNDFFNNIINDNSKDGIRNFFYSNSNIFNRNTVNFNGVNGIYLNGSSYNTIIYNIVNNNYNGIKMVSCGYNVIKYNVLYGNRECIVGESENHLIENNNCIDRIIIWPLIIVGLIIGLIIVISIIYVLKRTQSSVSTKKS